MASKQDQMIKQISEKIAQKFYGEGMPLISTAEVAFVTTVNYVLNQFFPEDKEFADAVKVTIIEDLVKQLTIINTLEGDAQ